jgi:hypothetical protein
MAIKKDKQNNGYKKRQTKQWLYKKTDNTMAI